MRLPQPFTDQLSHLLGADEYARFVAALDAEQPVSIRLNEGKWQTLFPDATLPALAVAVPWCRSGRYLDRRPSFTFDPLFHAGCYYVQEASSMFLEQALRQCLTTEPIVMLDLCAAPGGKSTHARSLLPEGSLLVANEVMRARSQVLAENLTKWGHPDVVVTNSDPADFTSLHGLFDVILTDVPCSGEGMFRKDPVAVAEWSPENVTTCWQRQRRILTDIWPALKPGGYLIYSTCTYNTQEDEENVRWLSEEFGAEVCPIPLSPDWGVIGNLLSGESFPVYRFLPHRTAGEGFFLALLRKPLEEGEAETFSFPSRGKNNSLREKKKIQGKGGKTIGPTREQMNQLRSWLKVDSAEYDLLAEGEAVTVFPHRWLSVWEALRASVRVCQAGLPLAELKGREWQPAHALAMSRLLNPDAFVSAEVSSPQAWAYLRKEAVTLSPSLPRGILLLTYRGVPLGFVKNVGNRANNLYPQEWRIRSGYQPDDAVERFAF